MIAADGMGYLWDVIDFTVMGLGGVNPKLHKIKRYFILMDFHLEVSQTALISYIK